MNRQYLFAKFRTTKKYFVFLLFQLVVSLFVVIVALAEPLKLKSNLTLVAEIMVALCISLDILVRSMSETNFLSSKGNRLDLAILGFLVLILLFVCLFVQERPYQDSLEADDILLLIIVCIRYSVQIGRLICLLRASHESIFLQKNLNEIDLNSVPRSRVQDEKNPQPEMQISAIVKNAIVAMHSHPRIIQDQRIPTMNEL